MPPVKRFFRFVIPSIVSMWIFSLYTIVDGLFVARGVGEQALAAVNLSMPLISLLFSLGVLLASGTATVLSICLGQRDLERARNIFNQNLVVVVAVSLLFTGILTLFLEPIALLLGATPSTLGYVKEYIGTLAFFAPFFTLSYNLEVQVKVNGAPHISTVGVLSCGMMNVVLDALFVLGFSWGVRGAALATGLAQVTSTAVFLLYFLTHREQLRLGSFRPDPAVYRRILPLGVSEGLSELSNGLVIFLFNRVILWVLGEDAIITYTIISYVNTLVLMSMIGTAQGIQPLVSFHLGAGETPLCHRLLRYGLRLVAGLSLFSFALVQTAAPLLVSLFLKEGSPLIPSSIHALRLYAAAFLFSGFNVVMAAFFTAMEKPAYALPISLGRSLVFLSAFLFSLPLLLGGNGVWLAPAAAELLCLVLTLFFAFQYRKKLVE